ncbi:ATP-binding protein [Alteromonas facilis]|uniref:ATP-binding protein n=1 Tax=Alteromonas facilis TaxID=2048004 RepID=UPI0013DAA5A6|nr:ATP-binding protein [Alteromonas facilis]
MLQLSPTVSGNPTYPDEQLTKEYSLILVNSFNESEFEARLMRTLMNGAAEHEEIVVLTVPPFYADSVDTISESTKQIILQSFNFQIKSLFPDENMVFSRVISLGRHASVFIDTNPQLFSSAERFFLHIDWQPKTGTLIPSDYSPQASFEQIMSLFPDTKRIAFIHGSRENTLDKRFVGQFRTRVPDNVELVYINPMLYESESLDALQRLPKGTPIIYINYKYVERNWETAHNWLVEQTDYPIFTIFGHNVDRYLGGAVVVPEKLGKAAIALAIHAPIALDKNPVISAQVNAQQLEKWGVSLSDLSSNMELVNETPNMISFQVVLEITVLFTVVILLLVLWMLFRAKVNAEKLKVAVEQANAANHAKSKFLANMSHEIRTPMNGVLGVLQILERADLTENAQTLVSRALYSATSLLTIINDILDYSKIEANKLTLESAPFSIQDVVDSVVNDVNKDALRKSLTLDVVLDEHFNDGWIGDPVRVKQILLNLVSNAVKFTSSGSVKVQISTVEYDHRQALKFNVIDTGIGMSEEARNRIFERFNQADSSTTRKYGGTGLGMSITASLIRLMNGRIEIESEEGSGTHVKVILPLKQSQIEYTQKKKGSSQAPSLNGVSILVAEDNDINREIIASMLSPCNANVDYVENGIKAVDAVQDNTYDLVLMDIQMPEMDGIEAFKVINKSHPQIPVIALTANVMADDIQHYIALGFVSHIGKPIDINALYETLRVFAVARASH